MYALLWLQRWARCQLWKHAVASADLNLRQPEAARYFGHVDSSVRDLLFVDGLAHHKQRLLQAALQSAWLSGVDGLALLFKVPLCQGLNKIQVEPRFLEESWLLHLLGQLRSVLTTVPSRRRPNSCWRVVLWVFIGQTNWLLTSIGNGYEANSRLMPTKRLWFMQSRQGCAESIS